MSTNVTSQSPYLRTSRNFPQEAQPLSVEINKSYVDIANFVNARTIGTYATNKPSITGNQWYLAGSQTKHQTLRQIYTLAALPNNSTAKIPTGINILPSTKFVNIYGTAESNTKGISVPLTPWSIDTMDAPYLRVNRNTANIEIITTSPNWTTYNATIVLEWIASS